MRPDDLLVASANRDAALHLVEGLVGGGVMVAVVSPGSRSTALALALHAHPGCTVHVVVDERVAGFVALGIARAARAPVVLLGTSGTAGAHWLPAIIEASHDRLGVIAITADRPPELHQCGAPQTTEQHAFFGPHVRLRQTLPVPGPAVGAEVFASAGARAAAAARGDGAQPAHLNAPFREPLWASDLPEATPPCAPRHRAPSSRPDPELAAHLARWCSRSPRGLILCGPDPRGDGRRDPALADAVAHLGRALGWPVLVDALSGLRYADVEHDFISSYETIVRDTSAVDRLAPERVLRIGRDPTSKHLGTFAAHAARHILAIDPTGTSLDPRHATGELLTGDPRSMIEGTLAHLDGTVDPTWVGAWRAVAEASARRLVDACSEPGWGGAIAATLASALPDDALLHVASGLAVRDLDAFALGPRGPHVTANRGTNGIDGTIGTTFGQALCWPGPTVALLGDLALIHDLGALAAAAALGANATLVVVDNGGGGIFRHLPIAGHPTVLRDLFLTPRPIELASLCVALGLGFQEVTDPEKLGALLRDDLRSPGVRILSLQVDGREDHMRRERALS